MLNSDRHDIADARPAAPAPDPQPAQSLLARWSKWLGGRPQAAAEPGEAAEAVPLSTREANRQRALLLPCFQARLTDVAANRAALTWQEQYRAADAQRRGAMLGLLAEVGASAAGPSEPGGKETPSDLSRALSNARVRFFKRLNALPEGLPFLLELRTDMLAWRARIPTLQGLDGDLEGLLSNWFDVGLLEMRRITWDSPASLLEKLIIYEAVHEIASWTDLRNRLDSDRRCYAFFHPRMPNEPLIFVEVAFCADMAGNVQSLLDEGAPMENLDKARWAIFYSISNTQQGLRGVSFGNFLLKRVIEELNGELPKIKRFATLSPIPGFCDWVRKRSAEDLAAIVRKEKAGMDAATGAQVLAAIQQAVDDDAAPPAVQAVAMRLAARYLVERKGSLPLDPVARFHLGNGARIERLNWKADTSRKGRAQSCGMMVNYAYELDALDDNLARLGEGKPETSRGVARLL
ncbi:malonyl-CoA decarboxylase family protein [Pigmentiphaga sp.]|uniref:malonyl-CoA decarboxylase domain-containing protein n=1 Tax=Pigmentiphaga sp. TaxID=1977564 RepID=UPI00128C0059|nr:malonyl-CoA decarboxylase family protein [Pigmentiphaga sp.]MPS30056.1 malonyl-CoA decarboxylase [Alcaligenaceae bacterium SAGV5]MPS55168.1 malonyl-CoA decarboxylase [Alcaligenaceae bacterium SAGV3]MPT57859.1 malonyl-CoA decarboxylase [Alcaligenaceae bacterium]